MAMMNYRFEAIDSQQVAVSGEIAALSVSDAVAQLEARGLTIRAIQRLPEADESSAHPVLATIIEDPAIAEQETLQRHLEQVLQRMREILPALQAYAQDLPSGRERRQLQTVLAILERGSAIEAASALRALPGYWIPLLSAAASSRDPGRVLRDFLQESQRSADLYRQWWQTLAYPLCLLGLAGTILVAMSFLVVPIYRNVFLEFELQLPWLTMFVVTIAKWIASGRVIITLLALVAMVALLWLARLLLPLSLRYAVADRWGLLLGRSAALARFSQFVADLLEAELAPPQALRLAGIAVNNSPVRRAAGRVAAAIERGEYAAQPQNTRVLSNTILTLFQSPLPLSTQVRVLRELSACYSQRTQSRLSWTRGIVEPIAICVVGLIVGVTALALFLPLLSLISALSG